jgi:hypothetical protein
MTKPHRALRIAAIFSNCALLVVFLAFPRISFSDWPAWLRVLGSCEFCERAAVSSVEYEDIETGTRTSVAVCELHAWSAPERHTPGSSKLFYLIASLLLHGIGIILLVCYPILLVFAIRSSSSTSKALSAAALTGGVLTALVMVYASELLAVEFKQTVNLARPLFWTVLLVGTYVLSQNVWIESPPPGHVGGRD